MKTRIAILIAALALLIASSASAELTAIANHDHITIGFFYHGSTVSVRGVADPDTDLIIKIASPETKDALKRKNKVGGVLWMNTESFEFAKVPNLYFIHCTKNVDDILSPEEAEKYGLGLKALTHTAEIEDLKDPARKDDLMAEFVKYKEASKMYGESGNDVQLTPNKDGKVDYYIMTQWPFQAPPGSYKATVYSVRGGKVVEVADSAVSVEQVGTVKYLADMAKNNGALYGALSIAAALAAGLGVGLIFGKGGGGSH